MPQMDAVVPAPRSPVPASRMTEDSLDARALECAAAFILVLDSAGGLARMNGVTRESMGASTQQVIGRPVWELLPSEEDRDSAEHNVRTLLESGTIRGQWESAYLCADGTRQRVAWNGSVLRGPSGELEHIVLVGMDVTAQRQHEAQLRLRAETDPLTGLLNRGSFASALDAALEPTAGVGAGLLFCDLDGFKEVNDSFGHAAGDALLIEVAGRLRALVRSSDVVSRLGGDEFVVLCVGSGRPEVKALATRVETAVRRPFEIAGEQVRIGVSVGTTIGRRGQSSEEVLARADSQMYAVKTMRRARRKAGLELDSIDDFSDDYELDE